MSSTQTEHCAAARQHCSFDTQSMDPSICPSLHPSQSKITNPFHPIIHNLGGARPRHNAAGHFTTHACATTPLGRSPICSLLRRIAFHSPRPNARFLVDLAPDSDLHHHHHHQLADDDTSAATANPLRDPHRFRGLHVREPPAGRPIPHCCSSPRRRCLDDSFLTDLDDKPTDR